MLNPLTHRRIIEKGRLGRAVIAFDDPQKGAGDDPIAKIERLAKLRASPALSEEEFERRKSRLLDGV